MFFSVETYGAQVLSYLIRMPLLNREANHSIWQKSWSTIKYSAHCLSLDFGSECLQRRKKSLSVFVLDSKTKEDDKIVLQRVGFEISRERQGLLLQSRKMAKRWQSFWKTHRNYREIEFHEFLSERSELFRPRSGQASDKFATGPSSETQGQAVEPGEKARRKFSSTGGRAPGYRLSQDHFQTVKRMLAPDWIGEQFLLSYFRTRRLLSRHSCLVPSPSFPNQTKERPMSRKTFRMLLAGAIQLALRKFCFWRITMYRK